ncbi:MAG: hypothetical protein Q9M92_01680 [Enterobacterales bacterium]|nr:hypothetical protein [Enterobacterales bacterium]
MARFIFVLSSLIIVMISHLVHAHSYFEGVADIVINPHKNRLEIMQRYTTHDLEISLSRKYNKRLSADQDIFTEYLKQYISESFYLVNQGVRIELEWVGSENGISETTIYQMNRNISALTGVTVHNQVLSDLFPKQLNRVNYQDSEKSGTLIFTASKQEALIAASISNP